MREATCKNLIAAAFAEGGRCSPTQSIELDASTKHVQPSIEDRESLAPAPRATPLMMFASKTRSHLNLERKKTENSGKATMPPPRGDSGHADDENEMKSAPPRPRRSFTKRTATTGDGVEVEM